MHSNRVFPVYGLRNWLVAGLMLVGMLRPVPIHGQSLEFRSAAEGGRALAVHVAGGYAFTGVANVLVVWDITDPSSPVEAADRLVGGDIRDIASAGQYLYVAASQAGFVVFDISDPTHPIEMAVFDTPGSAVSISLSADVAYVADETGGLRIVDVTNPAVPSEIAAETTSTNVTGVAVDGDYAYLSGEVALLILDVSNPASPAPAGFYDLTAQSRAVAVRGSHVYLTVDIHLMSIDVTDKATPVFVDAGLVDVGRNFALHGDYAFVPGQSGMRIFDISDPTQITLAGAVTARQGYDVALAGNLAYAAQGLDGFDIRDVSDVTNLGVVFDGRKGWDEGTAVTLVGDLAFVSATEDLLKIIDVSNSDAIAEIGNMQFTPYHLPPNITAVAATPTHAYVAQAPFGLSGVDVEIVDVTDPTQPVHAGTYNDAFNTVVINTMHVVGDLLYTAKGSYGLRIYDISDPLNPAHAGTAFTTSTANDLAVDGEIVYLLDGAVSLGLRVLDTSALPTINEIGSYATPGVAKAVAVDPLRDRLYIADEGHGLIILDVNTPANPTKLGELITIPDLTDVAVSGDVAYVVDAAGVHVVDVLEPASPQEVALFERTSGGSVQVVTLGERVLVLDPLAGLVSLTPARIASGIGDIAEARESALSQNTPNPFNPQTVIRYTVEVTGAVQLKVYDVGGRLVRTLVDGVRTAQAQPYAAVWDGRDEGGSTVSSGVYFYRLVAPGVAETKKMVLLK